MAKKKTSVAGGLIAKKKQGYYIEVPLEVKRELEEIFNYNDQFPPTSPSKVSARDVVEALGTKLGFKTSERALNRIAKQMGRVSYGQK